MKAAKFGFTVIELLVILGTLSLILLATVSFLMASLSSSGKAEAIKEVRQNGEAVLKTARVLLTSSSKVMGCTETIPATIPTQVSFISNSGTVVLGCMVNGPDVYIASNSARLTDQRVVVSDCEMYCLQPPGGSAYVYISFKLNPSGQAGMKPSEQVSQTFETSINLMGI